MNYLGKAWIEPKSLKQLGEALLLRDFVVFPGVEDGAGVTTFEGNDVLIVLHVSWGTMEAVEKVKIYALSIMPEDEDELFDSIYGLIEGVG